MPRTVTASRSLQAVPETRDPRGGDALRIFVSVSPRTVARLLLLVVALLTIAGLVSIIHQYVVSPNYRTALAHLFDLDEEMNLPTWYSSSMLLMCSCVIAAISYAKRRGRDRHSFQWTLLAVAFLLFSIDESASVHERFIEPLRFLMSARGVFYFAWVIPAIVLITGFGIYYIGFWLALPERTRMCFLISAALYVGGGLGVEMVSAYYADYYTDTNLTYAVITASEETFELLGISAFAYSLLSYIGRACVCISVVGYPAGQEEGGGSYRPEAPELSRMEVR